MSVSNSALQTEPPETQAFQALLDHERIHYNKVVVRTVFSGLTIPQAQIRRYDNPPADTPAPFEYAYHLLGDFCGKTIVDLGCGDGVNTVILAALGAKVIAVDVSDKSLELTGERARANGVRDKVSLVHCDASMIPIADSKVDRVFCASTLCHVDSLAAARQIRRILRPGGIAAFVEPISGPEWLMALTRLIPRRHYRITCQSALSIAQIERVSRAVGRGGRRRQFMLTSRALERIGIPPSALRKFHHFDDWILRYLPFTRALASPIVWEARKES